jgi:HEPN domain-containing protein
MHVLTAEWIAKAEGDLATAGRELRARTAPNYDAACFHAQQAAEKYLKAVLQEHGSIVPRTHILIALLELVRLIDSTFLTQRPHLILLDRFAVQYRYPGTTANRAEARQAYGAIREFRVFARASLGLT